MSKPLRFLSVCSGLEGASLATEAPTLKKCSNCKTSKPLDEFHRQAKGRLKRASWCKVCANSIYREARKRTYSPEQKRRWQIKTRYGLTVAEVEALFAAQNGCCGICRKPMARLHIDHDHVTGNVRGLLCHRCNIVIGGFDDAEFRDTALAWLNRGRA